MKKIILLFFPLTLSLGTAYSQSSTVYHETVSNWGTNNCFIGPSVNSLYTNTTNNTGVGAAALWFNAGPNNTAIGAASLRTGGEGCTAVGFSVLTNNKNPYDLSPTYNPGAYNTAVGFKSMQGNFYGDYNTAVGSESLFSNDSDHNSAFGYHALHENDDGSNNGAMGAYALYKNTSGYQNTAVGSSSLFSNTAGYRNTAIGTYALYANIQGVNNTASGNYALYNNNMGNNNSSHGYRALNANTTGSYNTAQGSYALDDNFGGNYNTAIGYNAGPAVDLLNNTTAIGYLAVPTASNQVRVGNNAITSIGGQVSWTAFSDGRFKKDIKEDVSGLEFITQLRPVSYTVDKEGLNKFLHIKDSSNQQGAKSIPVRQTGFIAQEVETLVKKTGYVFSGVDAPENENDPYGIRYAEFVVPLVKAVQEQQKQIEEQNKKIESLLKQLGSKSQSDTNAEASALLFQNNPNPFDAESEIKMTLPDNVGNARIMIYSLEGKQLKTIQIYERGDVRVAISANELSAGMYLYSLIVDGKVVDTKRMVLTK